MMQPTIADIRTEYKKRSLSENDVAPNAIQQFQIWWNEAVASKLDEVNSMTLATASADGVPSGRIVLLKGFDEQGFSFFTNYNSFKGLQLLENPHACLVFFWRELERQVVITGLVEKLTDAENDEYFNSRPEGSRVGAWTSPQSEVIENRAWLENHKAEIIKSFEGKQVTRPPHWGGYRVKPISVEFWQGRPSRLHDRLQYVIQPNGSWLIQRLAP